MYKAQGHEGIYLADGASIEFSTRTNSGARGGTYDVIVVDEAQELTDEQRDALMPTTIASDSGDPQVILVGTPPNHKCPGTVFRDLHDRAHAGELGDAWWLEWAADGIGDPHDVDRWYECNPMMGYRINERSMKSAADTTPPDSFAREYLGWWSDKAENAPKPVIPAEDCIESNRVSMRNVALMAMAVESDTTMEGLSDGQRSVMPHFKNPRTPSLASTADAMVKIAGALDGFAQTREFLSGMGFETAEVESIRSQLAAAANQRALLSIMGGGTEGAE